MKNELKVFKNEQFGEVRVIKVDGKEYFSGSDVAKALGYAIPSKAVNTHCKGVSKMEVPTNGGKQEMIFITEGDVYRLIVKSKLPQAEKFESWVFEEVLPSVRKHGAYMTEDTLEKALTSPDFLIQLATQLKNEQEARRKAELKIEQDKPLVDFANTVGEKADNIDMGEMAKLINNENINIGRNRLFAFLKEQKVLMNNNLPYQKYIDNKYFEVIEVIKHTPYGSKIFQKCMVTGKGQIYIVQKVKECFGDRKSA